MGITFKLQDGFVKKEEWMALAQEVERCHHALREKTGKGNDFVGW